MTHKEEVIEILNILKESSENTVGNRISKKQNFTILSDVSPNSFLFVIDSAIEEMKRCRNE